MSTCCKIAANEVRLWFTSLDKLKPGIHRFYRTLAVDEKARANQFYFERDKHHYIMVHGILRRLMGSYTGAAPAVLEFYTQTGGKPHLKRSHDDDRFEFSISKSNGLAIFALTCGHQVGVDIEYNATVPDMNRVARTFFSSSEYTLFRQLPRHLRKHAFFNCWTRKEALLKATGEGLSRSMKSFEVNFDTLQRPIPLELNVKAAEGQKWAIYGFEPCRNYTAAVAVEQNDLEFNISELALEMVL